jgi:hypothetical protein
VADFTFNEDHIRAIVKARRDGLDALDEEERALYDEFAAEAGRWAAAIPSDQDQRWAEAYDAVEQLSPEWQMRLQDWTLDEVHAFLPLIRGGD